VRSSCEIVALLVLEPPLARDVAERVDDAVGDPDGDERQPEITPADLEREGDGPRRRALRGDGNPPGKRGPPGDDVRECATDDLLGVEPSGERRRAVPQTDEAVAVDEEGAVAECLEHMSRLLALGRDRAGGCLGRFEPAPFLLQPHVADGRSHLGDEAVEQLELLRRVLASVGHQLDDADDVPLVPDGRHHRRADPGRAGLGDLLDVPFGIDVVVLARALDALGDVVEQLGLAADDHAALHAAAFAVQRQRRQLRRIDDVAVAPRVLAADEVVALVVRRDDEPVVGDDVGEQLVEALVDAIGLVGLAEPAGCMEQELGQLGLSSQIAVDHGCT
jgi:hypothetical protein